ncbi:hypothetical protein [Pseudescherichia vulneris]|uniref:hypothetical protein n=1 Tax=Pseudescherichia vulneris TaxID=566 RepID=UPI0030185624
MKYQSVSKVFCRLIFTLPIIGFSFSASAAIVRTEMVFYDVATASQRSYSLHMLPTANGAQATLSRKDSELSVSTIVTTCFNTLPPENLQGYLSLKESNIQYADPALSSFLSFSQDNQLRVAMKPLANAQSVLLDKDSLNVLVVDPTMITLGRAGCQR